MSVRNRGNAHKERLAYEAARIMLEQGLTDLEMARRKAAERVGIFDRRQWPSNALVKEAVLAQQRLFASATHQTEVRLLRREIIQAMRMLINFHPRLIGLALHGLTNRKQGVELLLFAERAEDVLLALMAWGIPYWTGERSLRYADGQRITHPMFGFLANEIPFRLIVVPPRTRRHPPLDPITERPHLGANLVDVERSLERDEGRAI
ncbi:hypothetical protein GWK36_00235 [Caldichromatium japonicum]|uniref:Uncharacterized protein n=1 Tax=Caldichromatium japonicum TaxID=2699430 RepID=A0A6G7V9Z9_9GAMM|nr:hypothetical protein [Caldichromatium japonicum]QIK36686.1 hypothetical protein GWK36_00235 [Caldichromatium japonicum]